MNDQTIADENRDLAAIVTAGVLVAVSLVLGVVVWLITARVERIFKELGVQLPGITILALEPLAQAITLVMLVGSAAIIAIKGLRMIGLCSWVMVLFLYLGFWTLAFGLPYVKITKQLGEQSSGP